MTILELSDAEVGRGERFVLEARSVRLDAGDRLGVVGPSGAGKSTFLDLLALLAWPRVLGAMRLVPKVGAEAIDLRKLLLERRIDRLARIRAGAIGYILQDGGLLPYLTVRANALLAARLAGAVERTRRRIEASADALGIAHLLDHRPAQLSGGERQRAAVLRTLAGGARLVVADEPTASLDASTADAVMRSLVATAGAQGAALVCVSHDEALLERHGFARRRVTVAEDGGGLRRAVLDDG